MTEPSPGAFGLARRAIARRILHVPIAYLVILGLAADFGFNSFHAFLLTTALVYAIAALGLNVSAGLLGQLSLGQGAAFGVGAYVAAIVTTRYGWPIIGALPLGAAAGLLLGLIMGAPASRIGLIGLAMTSLGYTVVFGDLTTGLTITGGPSGIPNIQGRLIPGVGVIGPAAIFIVVLTVATATYALCWSIRSSHWGRSCIAVKNNDIGAAALGISPYRHRVVGFGIGSAIGAVGGVLYVYVTGVVSPDSFGISLSLMFLLMVVIGGAGTVVGPVLGASLIGVLPLLLTSYPNISSYIYGGVLIVVVRLLPRGLIPRTGMRVRERRHKTDAASRAACWRDHAGALITEGDRDPRRENLQRPADSRGP